MIHRVRSAALGVAVLGALVGGTLLLARSGVAGVSFAGDLRPGGRLERLALPVLEGTGRLDYATFSRRPLVINFFASWCPSCIGEMPGFEEVHRQLGGRVGFIGISQSDSKSASIDLVHKTGVTYPTGMDPSGEFFQAWTPLGMPTTLFIRPGGRIAYVYTGGLDAATLQTLITWYLGVEI